MSELRSHHRTHPPHVVSINFLSLPGTPLAMRLYFLLVLMNAGLSGSLAATVAASQCQEAPSVREPGLARERCELVGTALVETYRSTVIPNDPYSTDLDRRKLVTVRGPDPIWIKKINGISGNNQYDVNESAVNKPPFSEEIYRTYKERTVAVNGWLIGINQVQCRSTRHGPGYVFMCATSFKKGQEFSMSISECFPLEEKSRFYKTINSHHLEINK